MQEEEERTAARQTTAKGEQANSSGKVPPALRNIGLWAPLAPHWELLERGVLPPPWLPNCDEQETPVDLSLGYVDR